MARATLRGLDRVRALASVALLGAAAMGATACGPLTIRTWVTIVEDESSGQIQTGVGAPVAIDRLQGGFLAKVKLDTTQILSGPLHGTMELEKIRIAGKAPGGIGTICTWGNPAVPSAGTVTLDLLGGASSADLDLAIKASTFLNQLFNLPPVELNQPVSFDLGSGLSLDQLAAAAADGSADGLFATEAAFAGSSVIGTLPVTFGLDLSVTNVATPPSFDGDLLASCAPKFAEQGEALYFGLNSKSSYLRAKLGDDPAAPLAISLADVGAAPGDTLRLERVGTYSDATELKDGTDTAMTGIFSSSDEVLGALSRTRVPGAVDAGSDVKTGYWKCLLLPWCFVSTDVPQDFRIGSRTDVVVPAGAEYLIVAPLPGSYWWSDDSGFGFGVDVTVNPEP
jgi:hypothetical protein